ncbi:MAG: ATPase, partial [Spirochaetia bacterium]|nr:ATPase [Spirochaetia bacterium]
MTNIAFRKKVSMTFVATALMLLASAFIFAPGAFAATT